MVCLNLRPIFCTLAVAGARGSGAAATIGNLFSLSSSLSSLSPPKANAFAYMYFRGTCNNLMNALYFQLDRFTLHLHSCRCGGHRWGRDGGDFSFCVVYLNTPPQCVLACSMRVHSAMTEPGLFMCLHQHCHPCVPLGILYQQTVYFYAQQTPSLYDFHHVCLAYAQCLYVAS